MQPQALEKAVQALQKCARLAVVTGAGISAESGIPTFREAGTGLWSRFKPEELATPEAFSRDPELVWRWYFWRRSLIAQAGPSPAHQTLVQFEEKFGQFLLITQNVDGLHERAGSKKIVEIHGNIQKSYCSQCGVNQVVHDRDHYDSLTEKLISIPQCLACSSALRPGVVWFGEALPKAELERAFEFVSQCDVCLSIGTSGIVHPAASLPLLASESGATTIEINPTPSAISDKMEVVIEAPAGKVLPWIWNQLERLSK